MTWILRPSGRFPHFCPIHFIYYMTFIQSTDSIRNDDAGAALSLDITNPVHALYAAAAVTTGATVVTALGVTTIAAPALVLLPASAAAAMAAGAAFMNGRADDARSDADADVIPASA